MTQETKSTQPQDETLDTNSSQPEVVIRDLDSPTPNKDVTPTAMAEGSAPVKDEQVEVSEDVRKLLEEQKAQIDNLKKGLYDKGREVADIKKAFSNVAEPTSEQPDDVDTAVETLKERGVLTKEDLAAFKNELNENRELDNIVAANPAINRGLLEDLAKANPEMNFYDVVEKHKKTLLGDAQLQKAHSQHVMGEPIAKKASEPIRPSDMNDTDFGAYLEKNSTGSKYLTHGNKYF